MYIVFIFVFVILFYVRSNYLEGFDSSISNLKYTEPFKLIYKPDLYMNFLEDLNYSFKKNNKETKICDYKINREMQKKSLNETFEKVSSNTDIFNSPVFSKDDKSIMFVKNKKDECVYKAQHISEYTNPMFYLSESKNFPPKWIGPYKDVPLPKYIDLKQWSNMYNCCKNNF